MSFAALKVMYGRSAWLVLPRVLGMVGLIILCGGLVLFISESPAYTGLFVLVAASSAIGKVRVERRQFARTAFQRTVSCEALGCSEILKSVTLDLSERGFFVQTSTPYSLLTRFRFELEVAPGSTPIRGHAVVRWINRHSPRGMGVEIVQLEETHRLVSLLGQVTKERLSHRVFRLFGLQ